MKFDNFNTGAFNNFNSATSFGFGYGNNYNAGQSSFMLLNPITGYYGQQGFREVALPEAEIERYVDFYDAILENNTEKIKVKKKFN